MEPNVSSLSYESFMCDLQKEGDSMDNPSKAVNSTMLSSTQDKAPAAAAGTKKRKVISLPLPYKCKECAKEFRQLDYLRAHFMKHLGGGMGGADGGEKPPFICRQPGCSRSFFAKQERKNHEIRHITMGKANCERCEMFEKKNSPNYLLLKI